MTTDLSTQYLFRANIPVSVGPWITVLFTSPLHSSVNINLVTPLCMRGRIVKHDTSCKWLYAVRSNFFKTKWCFKGVQKRKIFPLFTCLVQPYFSSQLSLYFSNTAFLEGVIENILLIYSKNVILWISNV